MGRSSRRLERTPNSRNEMIKEQVLILKVRYDDEEDQTPHTWNWTELVRNDHEIEVVNHGKAEIAQDG